jgi:hypothetical protein
MTVLSRGARVRRGGRRPGWLLLTALLVFALAASSALVFTNRVELLKLAVILALWAAVVAAFVSVIYRRQSDADQARVRDLKLVYDLQLDREISARREYELTVESQLRRELGSELRAHAADEVAALRVELSALRTNLEVLFGTDFDQRPALETERRVVRGYSDWEPENEHRHDRLNRVASVRAEEPASRAESDSIIDVPEEPLTTPPQQAPAEEYQAAHTYQPSGAAEPYSGSHRRQADLSGGRAPQGQRQPAGGWTPGDHRPHRVARAPRQRSKPAPQPRSRRHHGAEPPPAEPTATQPRSEQHRRDSFAPPQPPQPRDPATDLPTGGSDDEWRPDGRPNGNADSDLPNDADSGTGRDNNTVRAEDSVAAGGPTPVTPPPAQRHGRHSNTAESAANRAGAGRHDGEAGRRRRADHSAEIDTDSGGSAAPPAKPSPTTSSSPDAAPVTVPPSSLAARHRSSDESVNANGPNGPNGPQNVGQSVADLLARLQTSPTASGRRRRHED